MPTAVDQGGTAYGLRTRSACGFAIPSPRPHAAGRGRRRAQRRRGASRGSCSRYRSTTSISACRSGEIGGLLHGAVRHAGSAERGSAGPANSPPSEGYFIKFGDGYLAISQAFAPDTPGLDHYSLGLRDYDKAKMAAKMQAGGIAVLPRSSNDLWVADLDGGMMQLRPPGGWARQTATPYRGRPVSGLRVAAVDEPFRHAECGSGLSPVTSYRRLFGTEIASAASSGSRGVLGIGDSVLELDFGLRRIPSKSRPGSHPYRGQGFHRRGGCTRRARTRHCDGRAGRAGNAAHRAIRTA